MLLTDKSESGKWLKMVLPIVQGKSSQGAFSLASGGTTVVVGGDYQNDRLTDSVANYLPNDEHARSKATLPSRPPAGFQSSVEFINNDIFVATGTPGSNITTDGGKTWTKIDDTSFNVCRKAKHGKLVLFAGNGGKTGILKL